MLTAFGFLLKLDGIAALQREHSFEVRIQSLNSSAWEGYLQFGHKTTPRPLSSGNFGNLKQKIHLKSSNDKYDALGLKLVRFRTFEAGLTLFLWVLLDVLVLVVCLCDVGVVLDDLILDLVVRVVVLVEGVGVITLVVRTRCLSLVGAAKLLIVLVRFAM